MEKLHVLFFFREHGEHLFGIWLHHSGLLTDVDAVEKLPDVLLSDCGGLLDQGSWKEIRGEWEEKMNDRMQQVGLGLTERIFNYKTWQQYEYISAL